MTIVDLPQGVMVPSVAAVLADLADCVCNELATTGAGPTCWCGLVPGAIATWDGCGECSGGHCGMGWVRLDTVFPFREFPIPSAELRCFLPLAWRVEVGSLRCMPTSADGSMPSPLELAEVALAQTVDAAALYRALTCCNIQTAPEFYTPVGPQGGCVGGFWNAILVAD